MNSRRTFLKWVGLSSAMVATGNVPLMAKSAREREITILHTNDTHSHLEPFPLTHKQYPGMGGVAARKKIIDQIRRESTATLLFDAGDIFQGTPYFNFFLGEPEIMAMNNLGYDGATMGNHEFDGGMDNIHKQFSKAQFPLICTNYNFTNTVLSNITKPYQVYVHNNIRVGVFGLGVELEGLVMKELCEGVIYMDPIQTANEMSSFLKNEEKCDLIIVLSHLGYKYKSNKVSDIHLAENTNNIDIIIGGHTHTFLDHADIRRNLSGQEVLINQVGWAGINLGKINVKFTGKKRKISSESHSVIVDKKSILF